jgi:hypothetical protein
MTKNATIDTCGYLSFPSCNSNNWGEKQSHCWKVRVYILIPFQSLQILILSRLELEWHPYQKCTLPVKLKNLAFQKKAQYCKQEHSDLNWEFEVWSFLFCQLNYTLFLLSARFALNKFLMAGLR